MEFWSVCKQTSILYILQWPWPHGIHRRRRVLRFEYQISFWFARTKNWSLIVDILNSVAVNDSLPGNTGDMRSIYRNRRCSRKISCRRNTTTRSPGTRFIVIVALCNRQITCDNNNKLLHICNCNLSISLSLKCIFAWCALSSFRLRESLQRIASDGNERNAWIYHRCDLWY